MYVFYIYGETMKRKKVYNQRYYLSERKLLVEPW